MANEKVELIELNNGWFTSPKTNYITVNKKGEVLLADGTITVGKFNGSGYRTVSINGTSFLIHRIMALTFLDQIPGKSIVNHIDGDKTNNIIDNLEWTDYTGNIEHAFKTGLRSDNKPVIVRDLETDEITEFYSLQEAARFFKVNGSIVWTYLHSRRKNPFKLKWEVVYKGDKIGLLSKGDIRTFTPGWCRGIVVIKKTGELERWLDTVNLAKAFNVSKALITFYLRRKAANNSNVFRGMSLFYEDEYLKEHPKEREVILTMKVNGTESKRGSKSLTPQKPKPIIVLNTETNETTNYESLNQFCKIMNVPKHGVKRSVTLKGRWRHFKIKYVK